MLGGLVAAIINIGFLFFASDIELSVFISTGIIWIAIGILISASDFNINGIFKGVLISLLVSAPSLVFTFMSSFSGAIWTLINTIIVGAFLGFIIEKITKKIIN